MYTQCPACKTLFNVTAAQLRSARGTVQCGECSETFDALEHLTDGHIPRIEQHGDRTVLRSASEHNEALDEPVASENEEGDDYADTIVELTDLDQSLESVFTDTKADDGDPMLASNIAMDAIALDDDEPRPQPPARRSTANENAFDALIPAILPPSTSPELERTGELRALRDLKRGRPTPMLQPATTESERRHEDTAEHNGTDTARSRDEDEDDDEDATEPDDGDFDSNESPYPRVLEEDMAWLAQRKKRKRVRLGFFFLSLVLLLALGVQYAWFQPHDLAERYPLARPWLSKWCAYTRCSLPEQRDPRQVQVVSRDVRVHPTYEGALLITAVLVNNAGFVQPYPNMRFTLFNVNGQTIASRDFAPGDYLPDDIDIDEGMTPKSPTQITLDIVAPEEAAVSFEFKFL